MASKMRTTTTVAIRKPESRLIPISYCVLILISACHFVTRCDCVRLQTVSIFSDSGAIENYTNNVPDLSKVSSIVQSNQLESICSEAGVWAFFTSPKYTDSSSSYGYHPATPPWSCNERRVSAYMTPYKSIRHLGNLNLDESGISLYSEPLFAADEIYFNGDALSLPAQFHMNSFGFTGLDNWTIFSNPNFSGDAVCLCSENGVAVATTATPTHMPNNYNENSGSGASGVTFEERLSFNVGSLRKSCYGSQVWLVNGEFIRPQEVLNSSVVAGGGSTGRPHTEAEKTRDNYLESRHALKLQAASNSYEPPLCLAGKELNLPFPIKFQNFTAQLDSSWRIYSHTNFRGNSICLRGSGTFNVSARIGSIRAGCNDTDDGMEEDSDYSRVTVTVTSTEGRRRPGGSSTFRPRYMSTQSVTTGSASYDYDTTTEVAYDSSTALYSDYENSIEHGGVGGQASTASSQHGQQSQGNRKDYGRVSSTFSVTDADAGDNDDPDNVGGGSTSYYDESLDGLPTTSARPSQRLRPTYIRPNPSSELPTTTTSSVGGDGRRGSETGSPYPTSRPPAGPSFTPTTTQPWEGERGSTHTPGTTPTQGSVRGGFGRNLRPSSDTAPDSINSVTDDTAEGGPGSLGSTTRSRQGTGTSTPTPTRISPDEAIRQFYNTTASSINRAAATGGGGAGASGQNRTRTGKSNQGQDGERISNADTNSIFFTAFIITLILLLLCIVLSIGLFAYFRSTRKGSSEVRPVPSNISISRPRSMQEIETPTPPPSHAPSSRN